MGTRNSRLLAVIALSVAVISIGMSVWLLYKSSKTAYVDTLRLFNEYKLKLDLEQKEDLVLRQVKSNVDSIKTEHDMLMRAQVKDTGKIRQLEIQIARLSDAFHDEYSRSNKSINEEVWKRLNPEIDEFSRKEGLELLVGANGMGTVLYGSKNKDLTDKLLRYVNKKYEEGN